MEYLIFFKWFIDKKKEEMKLMHYCLKCNWFKFNIACSFVIKFCSKFSCFLVILFSLYFNCKAKCAELGIRKLKKKKVSCYYFSSKMYTLVLFPIWRLRFTMLYFIRKFMLKTMNNHHIYNFKLTNYHTKTKKKNGKKGTIPKDDIVYCLKIKDLAFAHLCGQNKPNILHKSI